MTTTAGVIHGADAETRAQTVAVWQDQVRIPVLSKGRGPALVFFHGPWALAWDPFLDELARHFTVHAPEHPGPSPDAPDDIYKRDGLWDLVLCYDEVLEANTCRRSAAQSRRSLPALGRLIGGPSQPAGPRPRVSAGGGV